MALPPSAPASPGAPSTPPGSTGALDASRAARYARIALANIDREYPYQPGHVQQRAGDHADPRTLHPVFGGSYDWHSCVHMHWLLARLLRLHPHLAGCATIRERFDAHFRPEAVAAEVAYFARPGTESFERTYGWAWLLALVQELAAAADADGARWAAALEPLAQVIVQRYRAWLPRARYPIRHGVHPNAAFGLAFPLDFARARGDAGLAETLCAKARDWFAADADLPVAYEPSGSDFLSPALMEAELMRRVLDVHDYAAWLARAVPSWPAAVCEPVAVADRADPQIVHLDGLNLSRAWCLRGIASALPPADARSPLLREAAARHLAAGLAGLDEAHYVGSHWLATFAVLALTA